MTTRRAEVDPALEAAAAVLVTAVAIDAMVTAAARSRVAGVSPAATMAHMRRAVYRVIDGIVFATFQPVAVRLSEIDEPIGWVLT